MMICFFLSLLAPHWPAQRALVARRRFAHIARNVVDASEARCGRYVAVLVAVGVGVALDAVVSQALVLPTRGVEFVRGVAALLFVLAVTTSLSLKSTTTTTTTTTTTASTTRVWRSALRIVVAVLLVVTLITARDPTSAHYDQRGVDLLARGSPSAALDAFARSIASTPMRVQGYLGASHAAQRLNDDDAALRYLRGGLRRVPDSWQLAAALADHYARRRRDAINARHFARETLRLLDDVERWCAHTPRCDDERRLATLATQTAQRVLREFKVE